MNLQSQGAYIRLRELNQIPVVPHSLSLSRVALRVKRWKALASCHCSYRRHCPFSPRRDNTAAAPRGVNPLSLRYPRETASIGPLSLYLPLSLRRTRTRDVIRRWLHLVTERGRSLARRRMQEARGGERDATSSSIRSRGWSSGRKTERGKERESEGPHAPEGRTKDSIDRAGGRFRVYTCVYA